MLIETEIQVNFKTTLGDNFDGEEISEKEQKEIALEHLKDYAEEHNLDLADIEIIGVYATKS